MGTRRGYLWGCGLALLSAAAFPQTVLAGASTSVASTSSSSTQPNLQEGASGSAVLILQQDLNRLGYNVGVVDGAFGPKTLSAVLAFQKANQVPTTGFVGPLTWAALTQALAKQSGASGNNSKTGTGTQAIKSTSSTQSAGNPSTSSNTLARPHITHVRKASIVLQGKHVASPYVFTAYKTTYMPIWYLMHALAQLKVKTTWTNGVLALTTPATMPVDLSHPIGGTGPQAISVNGSIMAKVVEIAYPDPYTHHRVAFMPVWYLQKVMTRLNTKYLWNGTTWTIQQLPAYLVHAADGTLEGAYSTLTAAKASLQGDPGGTVQDSSGKVIYVAQASITYTVYDGTGQALGTYPTLVAAKTASTAKPGAIVKDSAGNVVYTVPATVTYSVYGPPESTGTAGTGSGTASPGTFSSLSAAKAAAAAIPGAVVVDSSGKLVYSSPIPYAVYQNNGTLVGVYASLTDAEKVVVNLPGAKVEDSSGSVVYAQPTWSSYQAFTANGSLVGAYVLLSDAEQALSNALGGTVKDASGSVLYTELAAPTYTAQDAAGTTLGVYNSLAQAANETQSTPGASVVDTSGNVLAITPMTPAYTVYTPQGVLIGFSDTLSIAQQEAASHAGAIVKDSSGAIVYTAPTPGSSGTGFSTVDLRYAAPSNVTAKSIDTYLAAQSSPLSGLGQAFMDAQRIYSVDANYLVSHAIWETGWGKSAIALAKNNLFGYGAFDTNPGADAGRFPSNEYAILFQGWEVRNNYLTAGSGLYVSPTLSGMNVHYATDPHWAAGISNLMGELSNYVGDSVNRYKQYKSTNQAPAPTSASEPVFYMNGAQALVTKVPNYSGLPYYSSWTLGAGQMFVRSLQSGDFGSDVRTLQSALNQQDNASLTVDGDFGPMTKAAVVQYQKQNGLPVTGVCDSTMWQKLVLGHVPTIPSGSKVQVDEIEQGLAGGYVIAWYHIVNYGWVNSQFVKFTNVYRLAVHDPKSPVDATVRVYDPNHSTIVLTTMHAGDFVVSANPTPQNGTIRILYADQTSGKPSQGLIQASQAQLTAIQ